MVDLYAFNGYIETRAMRSSCTQFAAWGERTRGTDVEGGMITGRTMDGEIDLRKVTVSHFLLFAVDPAEEGQKRYVSMMWPGFVATISGMNEEGFYTMENAGLTGPGPVVDRLVPFSWAMRECLARLGGQATPDDVKRLVDSFDNAAGGSNGPGCITLFAVPFTGQQRPAFVMRATASGKPSALRERSIPSFPRPSSSATIRASTGWIPPSREWSSGNRRPPPLSGATRRGRASSTGGTGAVVPLGAPWDAPYRSWTTFRFDDVFPAPPAVGEAGAGR